MDNQESGNPEISKEEEEEEESVREKLKERIAEEAQLLPPLLPLKFGNGLLLQYTIYTPGEDDKLHLLEMGLLTGLSSLALLMISSLATYTFKSAPLILNMETGKKRVVANLLMSFNKVVAVIQVTLLVLLFAYTTAHWDIVDFDLKDSESYVKKRIFMFTFIVSCVMFLTAVLAVLLLAYLQWFKSSPWSVESRLSKRARMTPARSLLPLGFANAMLGLYIAIPGDDHTVVGSKVYLLELCLFIGAATILLYTTETVGRILLMDALRDGVVCHVEDKLIRNLHRVRYVMVAVQFLCFCFVFGHCIQIYSGIGEPELHCPRNLLLVCTILSSVFIVSGLVALIIGVFAVI